MGVATGFVLTIADGPVLYHAGDTAVFGDMKLIRELYQPTVAMLPIGGHYTMGPKEAALAVKLSRSAGGAAAALRNLPAAQGHAASDLAALVDAGVKVVDWKPGEEYSA